MPPVSVSRISHLALAALGIAALPPVACSRTPTAPAVATVGALEFSATRTTVTVRNTGPTLARFFLVDATMMPLALFAPCDSTCAGVAPGATVDVPVSRIYGYAASTAQVMATWWLFTPGPNDRVDASIQSGMLRLP